MGERGRSVIGHDAEPDPLTSDDYIPGSANFHQTEAPTDASIGCVQATCRLSQCAVVGFGVEVMHRLYVGGLIIANRQRSPRSSCRVRHRMSSTGGPAATRSCYPSIHRDLGVVETRLLGLWSLPPGSPPTLAKQF